MHQSKGGSAMDNVTINNERPIFSDTKTVVGRLQTKQIALDTINRKMYNWLKV